MPETVYTTTREFDTISGKRVVSVDANGGSVTIAVKHGAEWITFSTFTTDGAEIMDFLGGRSYRFTVTGAATYAF